MDLIIQINMGDNSMRPIEPINRLIQTQYHLQCYHTKISSKLQAFLYTKKIERFLPRKGVLFGGDLGLNTFCRGCSSHMRFVRLLYPRGDKLEKVCTSYKI